jgi:hypothetical protein
MPPTAAAFSQLYLIGSTWFPTISVQDRDKPIRPCKRTSAIATSSTREEIKHVHCHEPVSGEKRFRGRI